MLFKVSISSFGKFAPEMQINDGKVKLTEIPGIGFELVPEIYTLLKTLKN